MLSEQVRRLVQCLVVALPIGMSGVGLAAQPPPVVAFASPALPTTADAVSLAVLPTCNAVEVPTRVGNTITLEVGPLIPGPICPRAALFPLGMLPAGSYTIEERDFSGTLLGSSVFQVTAPSTSLQLLGGRFAVTASWTEPGGSHAAHPAAAVQFSDESGYFWFFDPTNVELSVKVLDGTPLNHHFWVFISSMTNVAYTVTVEDTAPGCPLFATDCPTKTYTAKQGTNRNFIDLGSFSEP